MLAIWFSALISDQLLDICDRPSAVSCDSMMWRFTFTFKIVWKSTDTTSVLFQTLLPATSRLIAHNIWQMLKAESKDILDVIHFVCIGSQLNHLPGSMMPPLGRTKRIINWEKDSHPTSHLVAVSSAEQLVRFNGQPTHPPGLKNSQIVVFILSAYNLSCKRGTHNSYIYTLCRAVWPNLKLSCNTKNTNNTLIWWSNIWRQ